jgi:hypothetical protein
MFLTTNRVKVLDPAFKSRIHLSIAYPPLSEESRRELWTSFFEAGSSGQKPEWLDDTFLDKVSAVQVNGRQIRNIIRVAHCLAAKSRQSLGPENVLTALQALESFEIDFTQFIVTERLISKRRNPGEAPLHA